MSHSNKVLVTALISLFWWQTAVAQYTGPVAVETTSFGEDTFSIGLLTPQDGALPRDLWQGANAEDVGFLLDNIPTGFSDPVAAQIFRRALLSSGDGPANADTALTAKKLMTLARAGYFEQAASLAELAGGLDSRPALAESVAYADMMRGDVTAACRRGAGLQSGRNSAFWLKLRFFCYTVSGESAAADLTYNLLRDQNVLTPTDETLFTALATGVAPSGQLAIETGFQYAAVRQLKLPFNVADLEGAEGAVLVALATEKEAPQNVRVFAAERAAHLGLMTGQDLADIFTDFQFPVERLASVRSLLQEQPDNVLVDALVYQSVLQMNAIEFTDDKAGLIAASLATAATTERALALSVLYAPMISQLNTTSAYADYARYFALAGLLARDQNLAERWLISMITDPGFANGTEHGVILLQLMSIRNESRARTIGSYAGLTITRPETTGRRLELTSGNKSQSLLPELVGVSVPNSGVVSKGQAALVALLASHISATGDMNSIREVLQTKNLSLAGLDDVYAEGEFYKRVQEIVEKYRASPIRANNSTSGSGAGPAQAVNPGTDIVPRVKPDIDG
ncbi:hypothetical protein [Parvularcula sp. IMCC14364]|uniref:hypothetical protein n=1 Tax=Parvularcula sp. IMCC14364 TaxID=3067902 RepID=UPI0027425D1B|nr:hypothetical protein [Parvularcula sp. IMCC14364]